MSSQIQKILWNIVNGATSVMALKLYRIHIHKRLKSCGMMSYVKENKRSLFMLFGYVLPSFSKKFKGLKLAL